MTPLFIAIALLLRPFFWIVLMSFAFYVIFRFCPTWLKTILLTDIWEGVGITPPKDRH